MEPTTRGSSFSSGSSFGNPDSGTPHDTGSGTPAMVDQAKQTTSQVVDQVKQTAGPMVEQMKQQASVRLTGQIDQAAEGLGTASETIRNVSQQLRDNGQAPVAEYVDRAADHVEHISTYLRGKDLDLLVSDVEHFARRSPQMFIAGALGLGMLAARFLKSTPEQTKPKITVSDRLSTPRFTSSWQSPSEYHGISTGSPSSMPSSGMSSTSSSFSSPSSSPSTSSSPSSTSGMSGSSGSTPGTGSSSSSSPSSPSVSSSSGLGSTTPGTSPTIARPEDLPQSTEPMNPLNRPTTGEPGTGFRRSA